MSFMKVLVISDTHHNARRIEAVMEREGTVDLVLHLGDLQGEGSYIQSIVNCPLQAVRGNCDYDREWPDETLIEVGGHRIFMTHGHRYNVDYDLYELEDMAKGCGADIAMFGHTHYPELVRREDGFVLLNPGSLGSPRQMPRVPSYMIMEIEEENGEVHFHQKYLEKK